MNLNLTTEILWIGAGNCLLISVLEKHKLFRLTGLIIVALLMWKWMGLFLRKNPFLICGDCLSLLNCSSHTVSIAKTATKNWSLDSFYEVPHLYKSTLQPCIKYCFWLVFLAANGYIGLLIIYLLPLLNPWLIAQMWLAKVFSIGITFVDVHLNWLNWFHFLIFVANPLVILIGCMIFCHHF